MTRTKRSTGFAQARPVRKPRTLGFLRLMSAARADREPIRNRKVPGERSDLTVGSLAQIRKAEWDK